MNRSVLCAAACFLLTSFGAGTTQAENWPAWRGAHYDSISREAAPVPTMWTAGQNVAWKLPLPGSAGATPVVWGDDIFLTSADELDLVLVCVSTAGQERWRRLVDTGNSLARGDEGNSASPSPVTDGHHVWVTMGTGVMAAFDFDGNQVWKQNLQEQVGTFDIQFGYSSTPVLDGDRLFVQVMSGDMKKGVEDAVGKLLCLNKTDGKVIWSVDRHMEGGYEAKHAYCSPMLYRDQTTEIIIVHGGDCTTAHSLDDGHEIWRCAGMNPTGDKFWRFVASPTAAEGVVVIPTCKKGVVLAVEANGTGDLTDKKLWVDEKTTDVPSPLIKDGLVYICMQNGTLYCLDLKTGKEVYSQQRLFSDRYRASPLYVDGKILLASRKGVVSVVKAGPAFELLAENDMGEAISSSPVFANGVLYIRTFDHLWAIRSPTAP